MALSRLLVAWVLVSAWFLVCAAGARRVAARRPGGWGRWLREGWWIPIGEALVLTLLAGLWFASLGSDGWILIFTLIGLLLAWPRPADGPRAKVALGRRLLLTAAGVGRILAAGGLLAWRLS